jgi:hypothetical protein
MQMPTRPPDEVRRSLAVYDFRYLSGRAAELIRTQVEAQV